MAHGMNNAVCPSHAHEVDEVMDGIKSRLGGLTGRRFWRSLEELNGTPEFEAYLHREFPVAASEFKDPVSRRNFLKLMGASLALAGVGGLTGCGERRAEKIVPYVVPPEQVVPGKPLYYATAFPFEGYGKGVLVESHMGRPTKVEGNPDHPESRGASDLFMQASILTLWDPDRAQIVRQAGQTATWSQLAAVLDRELSARKSRGGAGIRILTENVTSPTLAAQLNEFLTVFPQAKWHQWEPIGKRNTEAGARIAFGRDVNTLYHLDKASVILSLDADFIGGGVGRVRHNADFIAGRRLRTNKGQKGNVEGYGDAASASMNRLYVVESTPSLTGAMNDHRIVVKPSEVLGIAQAIAAGLGVTVGSGEAPVVQRFARQIEAIVADLRANAGRAVVVVGEEQPPILHAIGHAINAQLQAVGTTVTYTEPVRARVVDDLASLRELCNDIDAGAVELLIILGGNPVYTAPAELNFGERLKKVPLRIAQSLYYDETAFECHWHLPESHYLEQWGDIRAFDGTVSIIQPLINPLYQSKAQVELMSFLLGRGELNNLEIVQRTWRERAGEGTNFDEFWRNALKKGVIDGTAAPAVNVSVQANALANVELPAATSGMELVFRPDPNLWDGRYSNNGWLQELPKPLTKLTWDNAAMMSHATASAKGWKTGTVVKLEVSGRAVEATVLEMAGHPDDVVTVYLGHGRQRAGRVGNANANSGGFNAYQIRTSDAMWIAGGLQVGATGRTHPLAITQGHFAVDGRDHVHVTTLGEFKAGKKKDGHHAVHLDLYEDSTQWEERYSEELPDGTKKRHRWSMSIDMNACTGCNACVIACQAENNIPIVGKEQVINNREMHWLRIDTYYEGDAHEAEVYFQPMLCQHCENAPCEVVCPVGATSHSDEGLNEMTYNRCIGTRYCSNNCPYKVRRFNFLHWVGADPMPLMGRNPDVTLRDRGVMEKCTFCVQRINKTRIEMEKLKATAADEDSGLTPEEAKLRRDALMRDLVTACQQSCPTQAIVFGDVNWRFADGSRMEVAKMNDQEVSYAILDELNTHPRTKYLPRVRNHGEQWPTAPKLPGGHDAADRH